MRVLDGGQRVDKEVSLVQAAVLGGAPEHRAKSPKLAVVPCDGGSEENFLGQRDHARVTGQRVAESFGVGEPAGTQGGVRDHGGLAAPFGSDSLRSTGDERGG